MTDRVRQQVFNDATERVREQCVNDAPARTDALEQTRRQVFDYLLGTLDESEMEDVRARLKSDDPAYRHAMRLASDDVNRLKRLSDDTPTPPRLAERTCAKILDPVERMRMHRLRTQAITPPPPPANRFHWVDLVVACAILFIAALLIVPAINSSRFQARVAACQDNLRSVGQSLTEYSRRNHEEFPPVPAEGNLAVAGIWAPVLKDQGLLTEPQRVLCPETSEADANQFSVPSVDDLRRLAGQQLAHIQQKMGGSYGYCLGYMNRGTLLPTRNLGRDYFAILADAPSDRPDHQSLNHSGVGQNVLFEDDHVEFCSTTRPGNGRDDIYTNDNHLVAPGLHRDDSVLAASGTAPVVLVSLP